MQAPGDFTSWRTALGELVDGIHAQTTQALREARGDRAKQGALARPAGMGSGDITFGLDLPSEAFIDAWLLGQASAGPLSVLTEDRGWRHMGPDPERPGRATPLPGFNHGGPRIAIDPVDGTRNLMAGLRSAWTVISFAPPGEGMPSLADLSAGIVSELPTLAAARMRACWSHAGRCILQERELDSGALTSERELRVDADDRVDQGYFPFFRYEPKLRPDLAKLEAAFFARLEEHEGADLATVYDDQYISNAGQLMLLMAGTYRLIVDARALVARRARCSTQVSKPYDVAGAILCARAAGAVITAADGSELNFPIDTTTPVDMAGYANAATRARLEPHWLAVLRDDVQPSADA